MTQEMIKIDERFCGPPIWGNGGYVCGTLAGFIGPSAKVTLRRPIPLNKPIVVSQSNGSVQLLDGAECLAEAHATDLELEVPVSPTFKEATDASQHYIGFDAHPFDTCFVCGPSRCEGDGLRIFAGAVEGRDLVAAPWIPHEVLADEQGILRPEYLWAALDCPGYFAAMQNTAPCMALLGQLTGKIMPGSIQAGEQCVVIGWTIAAEGRKHQVGTALFNAAGQQCGVAQATWIELRVNS